MKNIKLAHRRFFKLAQVFFRLVGILAFSLGAIAQTETRTFDASGTFTVPHGVTSIQVQVWGGGGGGGFTGNNNSPAGGGGGGGFTQSNNFAVTPGANISFIVGKGGLGATTTTASNGEQSSFGSLTGNGGFGGQGGTGGAGGGRHWWNNNSIWGKRRHI